MNSIKIASLFSGIGGFEQGILNALGDRAEIVFASEIDKPARKSYQAIYGDEPHGDITQIHAADIPDHNLLVAGFPCQAFSIAGNRLGFSEARGTLFFEVARIAKEKQPETILLENVKGLVSHDKGRTLEVILTTLNEIGYLIDFEILNSKFFGVPQNRERIFIIAKRKDLITQEVWTGKNKMKKKLEGLDLETFNFNWPEQTTVKKKLSDILEDDVPEKFYLDEDKVSSLLKEIEEKKTKKKPDGSNIQVVGKANINGNDSIKRVYDTEGISPALDTMTGGNRQPKILCVNPRKTDKTQTYQQDRTYHPEGITPALCSGLSNLKILVKEATKKGYTEAQIGDAINFQFPNSKTRRGRVGKQIAQTLETQNNQAVITSDYKIRKLTPLECWRLQGFPDESFLKSMNAGTSNSQLYKQAGNAVSVPVIEALIKNLHQ